MMNSLEMRSPVRPPIPGDISICGGCGAFGVFNGLLQIEKPSRDMLKACFENAELMEMREQILGRL